MWVKVRSDYLSPTTVFVWSHPRLNNREDSLFLQWLIPVCHLPKVEPTSDYWKQTQMTQWLLWAIRSLWCCKQLSVLWIIKFLKGMFLFWHQLLVCFVPRPLEGRQSRRLHLLQEIQRVYCLLCGAAVHFSVSFSLSVQGRPGRQGFPGLTGPDGLKVRPNSHTSTAEPLLSLTEHPLPGFLLW